METIGIVTLVIIVLNGLISFKGFQDPIFFNRYVFQVGRILGNREYIRMISSGFLHVDWTHLIFNMLSLYFFSSDVEFVLGEGKLVVIYLMSLVGGNLFALFVHRHHGHYRAVGASGAVCGVIFAAIALFPGLEVMLFLIPIPFPGWVYGIAFVLYSVYGIRKNHGNIGHEAHLGGAVIGLVTAVVIQPQSLFDNTLPILLILAPSIIFIYIIMEKPQLLR